MIIEYHRPETLEAALDLLARTGSDTVPLGGGSALNTSGTQPLAVVDLQNLGLTAINRLDRKLILGAAMTLQTLLETPDIYPALKAAIQHEAAYNLRQVGTIAGTVVVASGRSPFATALLALSAELEIQPGDRWLNLGDFLPLRKDYQTGSLITAFRIPNHLKLAYEYVARTPADLPIVCAAVAQWPSGRTRVALGGYSSSPILAMDGPEPLGAETAARNAYQEAGDAWASASYRQEMAAVLTKRCLTTLGALPA